MMNRKFFDVRIFRIARWIFLTILVFFSVLWIEEAIRISINDAGYEMLWGCECGVPWYYETRALYVAFTGLFGGACLAFAALLLWTIRRRLWRSPA